MELRREALHLAEEFREQNRLSLLNLLSDSTSALTLFLLLLRNTGGRRALFRTIGRVFGGFSDTAKAFLIIASEVYLLTLWHGIGFSKSVLEARRQHLLCTGYACMLLF